MHGNLIYARHALLRAQLGVVHDALACVDHLHACNSDELPVAGLAKGRELVDIPENDEAALHACLLFYFLSRDLQI